MNNINKLFTNLMNLCADTASDGKFFFKDHKSSLGNTYRIFDYHLGSYSDWLKPGALECRGIMFEMINGSPVRIASRPMAKFFNLSELEGWKSMDVIDGMRAPELSEINYAMDKADGSLISTYQDICRIPGIDSSNIMLKSKGSIHSNQAVEASQYLYRDEQQDLKEFCEQFANIGYTVNMEWCAPNNQIVLCYNTPSLKILNIRHNESGLYYPIDELLGDPVFEKYCDGILDVPVKNQDWIDYVYNQTGIEGYVVIMNDGSMFKLKTNWYVALHHTKDSINDSKRLVVCCAENAGDDLRQMFKDDVNSLNKINIFENHVTSEIGKALSKLNAEYAKVKGKDRKTYAIHMTNAFASDRHFFQIAMKMFSGEDIQLVPQIVEVVKKYPEKFVPVGY